MRAAQEVHVQHDEDASSPSIPLSAWTHHMHRCLPASRRPLAARSHQSPCGACCQKDSAAAYHVWGQLKTHHALSLTTMKMTGSTPALADELVQADTGLVRPALPAALQKPIPFLPRPPHACGWASRAYSTRVRDDWWRNKDVVT